MDIGIGSIVCSKAGRDKGNFFVVVSVEDAYAYLCDGDIRKFDKPKKKKMKHLALTNEICGAIKEKLNSSGKVSNAELRRALAEFCQKDI